jgi:hypothetical protein
MRYALDDWVQAALSILLCYLGQFFRLPSLRTMTQCRVAERTTVLIGLRGLAGTQVRKRRWEGRDIATRQMPHHAKPRTMPNEQFKREVERELTGQETEPWEIIYFKLCKS